MSVARIATRQRQGGGGGEQRLGGGSFEGKCVQRTRWEGERRRRERGRKGEQEIGEVVAEYTSGQLSRL